MINSIPMTLMIIVSVFLLLIAIFYIEYHENKRTPFQSLYRLYEFLFNRWTYSILEQGKEKWYKSTSSGIKIPNSEYTRNYIIYKKVNKFDKSVKYEKKYID